MVFPVTSTKRNTLSSLVVSYLTPIFDSSKSKLLFCLFSISISLNPMPNVCANILKLSLKQSSPYPHDGLWYIISYLFFLAPNIKKYFNLSPYK